MKKRLLVLLLALALATGVLAAVVFADAGITSVSANNSNLATVINGYSDNDATHYIKLTGNITGSVTINKDVYLDLAGFTISGAVTVQDGYTLYCMDSKTDDYTATAYGQITGNVTGTGTVKAVPSGTVGKAFTYNNKTYHCGYMKVENGTALSFHCVFMENSSVTLETGLNGSTGKYSIENAGLFYNSTFLTNSVAAGAVKQYGVATSVSLTTESPAADWAAALTESIEADKNNVEGPRNLLYSTYGDFVTGEEVKGTAMTNIMSADFNPIQNISRANVKVYGRPYIITTDDEILFGDVVHDYSFKTLTESLDAYWQEEISDEIVSMYKNAGVTTIMNSWNIPYIKGMDAVYAKELRARRQTVTDYMKSMMNVQWTTVEDISYHYSYNNSTGEATTEAIYLPAYYDVDGDGTEDQIIYQGIPYSHGGGSLDSWTANAAGEADSNGVYTMYGITNNIMNGYVSPNGDVDRGDARLGNDCADSVLWAWGQVSDSLTFRYTGNMLKAMGCEYIGNYVMSYTNASGTTVTMADTKTTFPSVDNNFTGTAAICTFNGTDVMYEAYGMLQFGDVLVNRKSGADGGDGGHAMMVKSINVANQTVTVMDQTTTNETALRKYFRGTTTTQPSCLAYDAELGAYVAVLQNESTYTFEELYNNGYLPMSCSELLDATDEISAEADYTYSEAATATGAENLFVGTVSSKYPIEYIKLTITNTTTGASKESYCYRRETDRVGGSGTDKNYLTLPLTRFEEDADLGVLQGDFDYSVLGSGDYTCTYAVKLSNVKNEEVFRTVTFNVAEDTSDAYRYYYLENSASANFPTDVKKDAVADKAVNYYFMSGEGKTMDTSAKVALKQGDCCLVVFPNGETMLIDVAMKEYYPILEHNLKRLGITHIDYVLLSHPHDDHCGGLWEGAVKGSWNSTIKNYDYAESTLLRTFSVDEVFHSGLKNSGWESTGTYGSGYNKVTYTDTHMHVTNLISNYNTICGTSCKETIVKMGDELTFGKGDRAVTINVLWPGDVDITVTEELSYNGGTQTNTFTENYVADGQSLSASGDVNNRSVVMRLDYGEHSSLFAGDLYQTYKTGGMSSIYTKKDPAINTSFTPGEGDTGTWEDRYVKQGSMNDTMGAENALVGYYTQQGKLDLLNTDLLKMTHHGDASSSNTPAFFKAVSPKYAVATGFLAAETHWTLYKTVNSSGTEIKFVDTTQGNEGKDTNFFFDRWNGYTHVTAYSDTDGNMNVETSRHEYIYSHEATYTYTDTNSEYIKEGAYLYFGKNWTYRTEAEKEAQKPKY